MYAAPFFLFMQHVCLFANERVIQQDRTWIRFFGRLPSYLYSSQDILGVNNVCVSVCACVCACMVDWGGALWHVDLPDYLYAISKTLKVIKNSFK